MRVHLDTVEGLGHFLEFEAVLTAEMTDAEGQRQLDGLLQEFGIRPEDLLAGSYGELLAPIDDDAD